MVSKTFDWLSDEVFFHEDSNLAADALISHGTSVFMCNSLLELFGATTRSTDGWHGQAWLGWG